MNTWSEGREREREKEREREREKERERERERELSHRDSALPPEVWAAVQVGCHGDEL